MGRRYSHALLGAQLLHDTRLEAIVRDNGAWIRATGWHTVLIMVRFSLGNLKHLHNR